MLRPFYLHEPTTVGQAAGLLAETGEQGRVYAGGTEILYFLDLPQLQETIFVENKDGPGPRGAKGMGEGGIIAVAAAVGNAVAKATGVRIKTLPLRPDRVWERCFQSAVKS